MDPEQVLQVAVRAYWHEGPEVSLNAICQRAGVSKPSLYREFGSEDGLTAAALGRYAESVSAEMRELLTSGRRLVEKLDLLAAFAAEDPRNAYGCLFVKMRGARVQLGPQARSKVVEVDAGAVALYTDLFRQSLEKGEWSGHIPPEMAALYLHAQIGLALSQRALGADPATVRRLLELALSVLKG